MPEQVPLFKVAPSHVYVVAHWARHGWSLTIHATSGVPGAEAELVERYGPLSSEELVDVAGSSLAAVLEVGPTA